MEMEMVIFDASSMAETGCRAYAEAFDADLPPDVCMATAMQKPPAPSLSSLLESLLEMAFARFMPRLMEVEMGEAFLAAVDAKELELMMVMLNPANSRLRTTERFGGQDFSNVDVETEMVSRMDLEI